MISFEIPGKPQAKQRPRHGKGFTYTPKETVQFENWVRLCFRQAKQEKLDGALSAEIVFIYKKPKTSKKDYPARSDIDNCIKSVIDGLQGLAFDNDNQIVEIHATKSYGQEDMTTVSIKEKALF